MPREGEARLLDPEIRELRLIGAKRIELFRDGEWVPIGWKAANMLIHNNEMRQSLLNNPEVLREFDERYST
jgi:anaerobic selenocysteine-containing dehydrogenase